MVKELKVKGEESPIEKSMGEQSVLVQKAPGRQFSADRNKQSRMELKRPRRRAGNSFFMRNCTRILKRGNLPAADEVTSPITSRLGGAERSALEP